MKEFLISLLLFINTLVAFGHNPLSARYHLEVDAKASLLTINLSQDGVNQVLVNKYGKYYLENLDEKAFKELIVGYVKENFKVAIDGNKIELGEGGIRLGSHQTDLKFVLEPISREVNVLSIAIPAFKENNEHQSIFSYTIYGKKDKEILSKKNNYKAIVYLNEQQASYSWFLGIGLLILGIVTLLFMKKQKANKVSVN